VLYIKIKALYKEKRVACSIAELWVEFMYLCVLVYSRLSRKHLRLGWWTPIINTTVTFPITTSTISSNPSQLS
jgi:hypothetical protein